jgi:hypothetical protein
VTPQSRDRRRRVFRDSGLQDEFDERGFVVAGFLEPTQIEWLRDAWESLPSDVSAMPFSVTTMSSDLEYRARVHEIVAREIIARAEEILDDYRVCLCNFICKPAGESAAWGAGSAAPGLDVRGRERVLFDGALDSARGCR